MDGKTREYEWKPRKAQWYIKVHKTSSVFQKPMEWTGSRGAESQEYSLF